MPLPDLIEIVPLAKPIRAQLTVPGSKSITNRALILAALAQGETTLKGALWSEDTQVMVACLQALGFGVRVAPDPEETCNRIITVHGKGGEVPRGGTQVQPRELFVGNAGTAARFLAAFVCLGHGAYRLHGVPRMHERPQAALFKALRQLGYRVESTNDRLPAIIHGDRPRKADCSVSIQESSQFASALLLCADVGRWTVEVAGENSEESPYVAMTSKLIAAFPKSGGVFQIEPDASSGTYFLAADRLIPMETRYSERLGTSVSPALFEQISVMNWPLSGWQIDGAFPQVLLKTLFGAPDSRDATARASTSGLQIPASPHNPVLVSRKSDLGDGIMTAVILAPFATSPVRFTDLARLRLQECERVVALRTELTKCGAKVIEEGDTLTVYPSELHGAEIETYDDHRMAMCFATLGLKVPGIRIKNPACVKKTFPNFFQKFATPPPHGLGATILDAKTGRVLDVSDLFAA